MFSTKSKKIFLLIAMVALVTLLHYLTPISQATSHMFFTRFYYLPVILGGLFFGLRGGLITSISVTLIFSPFVLLHWLDLPAVVWDRLMEIILLNLAGMMVGSLVDRERRQREKNQELRTLAALGEAAASMAHEMKNLIIPIRGFLPKIRKTIPQCEKALDYLDIVEKESGRLETMAKEMLSFSRKAPVQKAEVEICPLLRETRDVLSELYLQKGVSLALQCPDDQATGFLDREKIRQVLVNLLENALEASGPGQTVHLVFQAQADHLQIEVQDHGRGITAENLDLIFIPFFTTKPKGTGLGLAVSRRIVEEHGGELSVQSPPGKGTTFSLRMPNQGKIDHP